MPQQPKQPTIPTPQIVIYLDLLGVPHAELPGLNGARQKIDLPEDFAARNPELINTLFTQRETLRLRANQNQNQTPNPIRETSTQLTNEQIAEQRAKEYWRRYNLATPEQQARMDTIRAETAEKLAQQEAERAKQIYVQTAKRHSIKLANRVIPDANRRPRSIRVSNNKNQKITYNPTRPTMDIDY